MSEELYKELCQAMYNGYWDSKGYGEEGGAFRVIEEIDKVFVKYGKEKFKYE